MSGTRIELPMVPPWGLLDGEFSSLFATSFRLPVYELGRTKVQTAGAHVRPLGTPTDHMHGDLWRLAHAIKKSDSARKISAAQGALKAAGFLLEQADLFDVRDDELRLGLGMATQYEDFSRTSLTGRVAQGMTLLMLEGKGYAFSERFGSFLDRHKASAAARAVITAKFAKKAMLGKPPSRWRKRKPWLSDLRTPDFVLEKHGSDRALAESKGSFVEPGNSPDIKGHLGSALDQLDGWDKLIGPTPMKSFAVATYLREVEDLHEEPSLVAFVDPEDQPNLDAIVPEPGDIRRASYAAWLGAMGLFAAAGRLLRGRKTEGEDINLLRVKILGREFALVVGGYWLNPGDARGIAALHWPWFHPRYVSHVQVVGLEVTALRALSQAIQTGSAQGLMELRPLESRRVYRDATEGYFTGSVFSDGSLFGSIHLESLMAASGFGEEGIRL